MLEIMRVEPVARTPVVTSDGRRVGTVVDAEEDARYVAVDPDAPTDALDALGWDATADRARLPDSDVADDGDPLRLNV